MKQPDFAINLIAVGAGYARARALFFVNFLAATTLLLTLGGCGALPDKPVRAAMYDFGPGPLSTPATTRQAPLSPLVLDEVKTAGGALDNLAVLYRLGYSNDQQLRPYALARWSMPPAQLLGQRARDKLGQRRVVFKAGEGLALSRSQGSLPLLLRLDLEEFSHFFEAPDKSVGLVRLRATVLEITPAGEKLLAQRKVIVQRPAPSADAPGGVRALTAATDAALEEIEQWLQQVQSAR